MPRETFQPAVYIMANHKNGTIYVGVTSNLVQRAWHHREGAGSGFTKRYGCKRLVWFELHGTMEDAILREKQLKSGSRAKKIALIETENPEWQDLYETILG
ncbi:MAG: GIY-YIG nuclease family protein [Erythrobacter sp.]|nr:GIY-YIG nuclease family protein [Erythrobacter sp.]